MLICKASMRRLKNRSVVLVGVVVVLLLVFSVGGAGASVEPDQTPATACSGNSVLEADGTCLDTGNDLEEEDHNAEHAGTLLSTGSNDVLNVDEGSISHDSIDQATVDSGDHHTKTTDTSAATECGSGSVWLDGDGTCHDLSNNHASHINGDLFISGSVTSSEIADEYVFNSGDTMTGTLATQGNITVQTSDGTEVGEVLAKQASGGDSGVDMVFMGSANTVDFQHYTSPGTKFLRVDYNGGNGRVAIPTGHLDMSSNAIQGVNTITSSNSCGGDYVFRADGSTCVDIDGIVTDNWVDEGSGDVGNALTWDSTNSEIDVASGGIADNEISDNTVDSSEIQNGDQFSIDGLDSVSDTRAIRFDAGDAMITNHDGHGNFNIKSGVDHNNNIITTAGGTHIRMMEDGSIQLKVDESTSTGNSFTQEIGLYLHNGEVSLNSANTVQLNLNSNDLYNVGGSNVDMSNGNINMGGGSIYSVENINVNNLIDTSGDGEVDMTQGADMSGSDLIDDSDNEVRFNDNVQVDNYINNSASSNGLILPVGNVYD